MTRLASRAAQDFILAFKVGAANCQLRKLGYKLIHLEFNLSNWIALLRNLNRSLSCFTSFSDIDTDNTQITSYTLFGLPRRYWTSGNPMSRTYLLLICPQAVANLPIGVTDIFCCPPISISSSIHSPSYTRKWLNHTTHSSSTDHTTCASSFCSCPIYRALGFEAR